MSPVGWECPRCGRCYAPSVVQCGSCLPVRDGADMLVSPPIEAVKEPTPMPTNLAPQRTQCIKCGQITTLAGEHAAVCPARSVVGASGWQPS